MAGQMTEYCLYGVLHYQREMDVYRRQQQAAVWQQHDARLRASVRRTSGTASTGQHALEIDGVWVPLELLKAWPTQAARDFRTANLKTFQERGGGKKGEQLNNAAVHLLSGWPTPQTSDSTGGGQAKRAMGETRHGSNLNDFAMLVGWTTPSASIRPGAERA
jgi:hypothetical protein